MAKSKYLKQKPVENFKSLFMKIENFDDLKYLLKYLYKIFKKDVKEAIKAFFAVLLIIICLIIFEQSCIFAESQYKNISKSYELGKIHEIILIIRKL